MESGSSSTSSEHEPTWMDEESNPAMLVFADIAQYWLDHNAQRVLEDLVRAKPALRRQKARAALKETQVRKIQGGKL